MSLSPTRTEIPIGRLRDAVTGRVITPEDADYDAMRTIVLGGTDPRPAVIVRVANAADVAAVVRLARENGAELAVRCGGHSGAGHSTVDGGIVIDVRDLTALDVDVEARTAWAESGLTAGEVTSALAEHGLAIGFGDTGSVGIGGITLGGGVGYLARKHGLTIDSLLAAEIVTADGEMLHVDAGSHPDLFWALRGGGGNFGVATRFQYRLADLPSFVGGMLVLPATAETVAGFIAAAEAAPDELSTIANIMNAPPMPFLPEEDPRPGGHPGACSPTPVDADSGERAIAPFRALADATGRHGEAVVLHRDVPAGGRLVSPDGGGTDHVHRPRRPRRGRGTDHGIPGNLGRDAARSTAAGPRRGDGPRARGRDRVRAPSQPASWSTSPRSTRARRIARSARRGSTGSSTALRQGDTSAYVNFLGDEGEERVRDGLPRRDVGPAGIGEALIRPRQRVPSEPEHRPGHRGHLRPDMRFHTTIVQTEKTATGIRIPDEVVDALGAGKRPAVTVTINGFTYRNTVAVMGGEYWVGVSAENRAGAGVAGGDEVDVDIELDTAPRVVTVPDDFAAALDGEPKARATFDGLSYSNKSWHVLQVTGAKTDETRQRRIARSVSSLKEGRIR